MNKTEDDTFLALKRIPFVTVFLHCTKDAMVGEQLGMKYIDYLKSAGWTPDELFEETDRRNIQLDVAKLSSPQWRRELEEKNGWM